MNDEFVNDVLRDMLAYLDNGQAEQLRRVLKHNLSGYEIQRRTDSTTEDASAENARLTGAFLSAKRIEGCSEKSLSYYRKTIETMSEKIGKGITHITTNDLRSYLTGYQTERKSSKVTIDNIRRILSSFFSWLEDEDYILKSPVRRIHKVKTAVTIKETYTDEALETMRDHCDSLRDLALIDMLASTGMRVGELYMVNWCFSIEMTLTLRSESVWCLVKAARREWSTLMPEPKSTFRTTLHKERIATTPCLCR